MASEASLVVNCPSCGKPCSCRLQGAAGVSWFTCPHCKARFYVQVTVGREASQAAPQRPEQVPPLKCLTQPFDWDYLEEFMRFSVALQEDFATLDRLPPGPAVEAARNELISTAQTVMAILDAQEMNDELDESIAQWRSIEEQMESQLGRRRQRRRRRLAAQAPLSGPAISPTESSSVPRQQGTQRLGNSAWGGPPAVQVSGYGCVIVRVGTDTVVVRDKCEGCGHVDSSTRQISKPTPNSRITGAFTCVKCGAHQDWAVEGS